MINIPYGLLRTLTYLTTKLSKISIYGKFDQKVNIAAVPVNHQGRQDCSSPESLWRIFFLNIRFWLGVCNSSYNFVLVKYLAGGIQLDEKQTQTNCNKVKNVPDLCLQCGAGKFKAKDKRSLMVCQLSNFSTSCLPAFKFQNCFRFVLNMVCGSFKIQVYKKKLLCFCI